MPSGWVLCSFTDPGSAESCWRAPGPPCEREHRGSPASACRGLYSGRGIPPIFLTLKIILERLCIGRLFPSRASALGRFSSMIPSRRFDGEGHRARLPRCVDPSRLQSSYSQ